MNTSEETQLKPKVELDWAPEPWHIVESGCIDEIAVLDANGEFIMGYSSHEGALSINDPNIHRIVACVNACRGIPTRDLWRRWKR